MTNIDALALEVDKPQRMIIKHPTTELPLRDKDGKEAYIELYSNDSAIARNQRRAITTSRLAMRNRNKITADRLESEGAEILAALTVGWHLVSPSREAIDLPFSPEAARQIYADHRMAWLREQVDEFTAERANFSPASSES